MAVHSTMQAILHTIQYQVLLVIGSSQHSTVLFMCICYGLYYEVFIRIIIERYYSTCIHQIHIIIWIMLIKIKPILPVFKATNTIERCK